MGENLHENHRKGMYKRYDEVGIKGFEEHEILEMLLFYAIPRKNTNHIAHRLIKEFGSLDAVFKAPPERLANVEGVGSATARYFELWRNALIEAEKGKSPKKLTQDNAEKHIKGLFKNETREALYIICLDSRDYILKEEKLSEGSFETVEIDPAKAVRTAVICNSAKVVFAHNHPSGICAASNADIEVTRLLEGALHLVGVTVRDHVIVANDRCISIMREYNVRKDRSLASKRGKR